MLTLRRRGKTGHFYIRGTVALGRRSIKVPEYCTRTRSRDAASHLMMEHERDLRHRLMFGAQALVKQSVLSDAFEAYLAKPVQPHSTDVARIAVLNEHVGTLSLNDLLDAWNLFRGSYLVHHAPAGQDRYRSLLQAAVNVYRAMHDLPSIRLKAIAFNNQRIRFLSKDQRDQLIDSYVPHVQPIATVFAFQGARTQEALQLQWGTAGADLERQTLFFGKTKTGNPRTVLMHPRVHSSLLELWTEQGKPDTGHVFLNRLGRPYTDTRDLPVQGGNPLASAHRSACRRAGLVDFTVHDWRHHWASHCVMAGVDLLTIMRLGGWKSLRMVQRYAAVDTAHMDDAVRKLM